MVQVPEKTITLEEFLTLPETKPASEYMNGQVVQKPIPQGRHSKLQGKLVTAINRIVEAQKIALALPELRCTYPAGSRNNVYCLCPLSPTNDHASSPSRVKCPFFGAHCDLPLS
ncbi:hypothetical protein C7B82_05680 [Stenomitos frigidus ULC18]|uniref:Putative restriction endonuclease domain-containing protein n=1 Tax=Stenomitos frigidus ULC18 TaxID=2107698 RepID=A0A2T1EIC9_9CYAN|nr:hypothetical protein C7B82_05680 [Stenomitos frigidus ULC18]